MAGVRYFANAANFMDFLLVVSSCIDTFVLAHTTSNSAGNIVRGAVFSRGEERTFGVVFSPGGQILLLGLYVSFAHVICLANSPICLANFADVCM